MSWKWPMVKLGEVLSKAGKSIEADPSSEYSEITVRMWGKGVVERGKVSGAKVNGRRFLNLEIPLPPLAEQRSAVSWRASRCWPHKSARRKD